MIDEDEVDLKEKPEDTRYIKNIISKLDPKHRECRQRHLIPTLPLLGLRRRWKSWPCGTYNLVLNFCSPPPPDPRRCSTCLNLNGWTAFWCHDMIFNPGTQGTARGANCPLCPRWTSTSCEHCHTWMIICWKVLAFAGRCTQSGTTPWRSIKKMLNSTLGTG